MATIGRYEDIQGWQKARELTNFVYAITKQEAFARDYALKDQIRRAAISVMSNIAEGFGRDSNRDFILQPKFLRELHQARYEKLPELRHLLEENFLQDEQERWFIPNPELQEHLEQLREKSLLREFQDYSAAVGASGRASKLKLFHTEAVRAGFKRAWADKSYGLIV